MIFTTIFLLAFRYLGAWKAIGSLTAVLGAWYYRRRSQTNHARDQLRGKMVLITGAASGIGRELANEFSKMRCELALLDTDETGLQNVCTQCVALGASRARGYRADVGSRPAVEATAARILADCGRPIDVLISNAGVVIGNRLIDTTIDEIESYINSDFLSTLWLIKAFLPSMLARGSIGKDGSPRGYGHVSVISSASALFGTARMGLYCATKAAVFMLVDSLRVELEKEGKTGVQVSTVFPRFVETPMIAGVADRRTFPLIAGKTTPAETAASKIVDGIACGRHNIFFPEIIRIFFLARAILPIKILDAVTFGLGLQYAFDSYKGRVMTGSTESYAGVSETTGMNMLQAIDELKVSHGHDMDARHDIERLTQQAVGEVPLQQAA